MHQKVMKDLQQCCVSCETVFSNHAKNPNSIKILWQEISWPCSGQEYTLSIKCLMGKVRKTPKEWWAAHLSQCPQPVQQITCKTCRGWNRAPFTCQSVLSGITSATGLTVTLNQPPAFCQVSGIRERQNKLIREVQTFLSWNLLHHFLILILGL